ncbi:MAG: hypothetical protein IT164_02060, partial [Bryobacterales bacterium]|nr:hypothetical protein [Bryobacterales bacterium]
MITPVREVSVTTNRLLPIALCAVLSGAAPGAEPAIQYFQFDPRVLRAEEASPVMVHAVIQNSPTRVEVVLLDGQVLPAALTGPGTYSVVIPGGNARANYQPGEGHNHAGYLDVYSGTVRTMRLNLVVNLRDATMPDVQVQPLGAREQRSRRVVNFRDDTLHFLAGTYFTALQRFYQFLPDDYDFIGLISQVEVPNNRGYAGLRNNVQGIGVAPQDAGAAAGSASRLQGFILYPTLGFFDLAELGSVHEIGHRWCCYSSQPLLAGGRPHWPVGDPAYGIMGFNIPGGNVGGQFPYRIQAQPNGTFLLEMIPHATGFNDFALSLMGLAPPSEGSPVRVVP